MINTIDMLIEFVQGPCKINQQTLLEGTFLELAYNIMNQGFESKASMRNLGNSTNINLPAWMIEQLKHKCLILLLSLLESQSDSNSVVKIIQYIPAETLANNMINSFLNYVTLYGLTYQDEAFNHVI